MNKSSEVATGGVLTALAVVIMTLSNVFTTLSYTLAIAAGLCVMVALVELGRRGAWLVFAASAILAGILVASKENVVLYVGLFGYYPILKSMIEKIDRPRLEWGIKLLVANGAFAAMAAVLWYVLRIPMEGGIYFAVLLWLLANGCLVLYDKVLALATQQYIHRFKKRG
ncbi:MAG: hypothetical protein ACOX7F_08070 [Eubacteriales bacterium]|jgi:hypothetical protein